MIFEFLRKQLETIPDLVGKVLPTGATIDDLDGPMVVYSFSKRIPTKDLSGEVHHYTEEIMLDFLGQDYDLLHELYYLAEEALSVSNLDTGAGEYIFSTTALSPEPETHDLETGLIRRTMQLNVIWCPI